jgi:hypothetical protein
MDLEPCESLAPIVLQPGMHGCAVHRKVLGNLLAPTSIACHPRES